MKIAKLLSFLVGAFVFTYVEFTARADWSVVGPPHWTQTSITGSGGVSYFAHTSSTFPGCYTITSRPVVRSGTNLTQEIYQEYWSGPGMYCLPEAHAETHVSVLGTLESGTYKFTVLSINEPVWGEPPDPGLTPLAQWTFTVPADAPNVASVSKSGESLEISVAGVPNVEYVLQCSSNLTNWVSVKTNIGGPFVWTTAVTDSNLFYRTVITGQ